MNFKNFFILGFLLVVLVALPVSFAADINTNDFNSDDIDFTYSDLNYIDVNNSYDNLSHNYSSNISSDSSFESSSSFDYNLGINSDTLYVNGSYTGQIEDGSINCPFKTINKAVDYFMNNSSYFNKLFIANSDYIITDAMNIDNISDINVIGESLEGVTINCNKHYLFAFTHCIASISNLTIYNGFF